MNAVQFASRLPLLVPLLAMVLVVATGTDALAEPAQPMSRSDMVWLVLAVAGIAFLVCAPIGAWFIYTGYKGRALALESQGWPTTQGKVLESGVQDIRRRVKGGTNTTYKPVMRYEYVVDGTRYEADVIQFGMTEQATLMKADAFVFERPVGAACTVHYKAADPKVATLDTSSKSAQGRILAGWFAALGMPVLVGIVIAIIAWFVA